MTVPADQKFPAIATNAAWQKKKSFVDKAKASTKTGLGADLDSALLKWNAIPWKDLDAAKLAAKTAAAAAKQLQTAKAALVQVQQARAALDTARATARATATNNALSKTAQTAATTIAADLLKAIGRLDSVKTTDFDQALSRLEANELLKIYKLTFTSGGKQVATGGAATWDRKVLKVNGMAWKVGAANDYKGKTITVRGEPDGNQHYEGISKIFANDMKLDTVSGSSATFKP